VDKLDQLWQDALRAINIPLERAVLALSSLGVSQAILREIYELDDESLQEAIRKGLQEGKDSRLKKLSPEEYDAPDYDEAPPFGKAHLEDLLKQPEMPFNREELEYKWEPLEAPLYRVGESGFEEIDSTRAKFRLHESRNIIQFRDRLKEIFLAPSKLELLILLPCPGKGPNHHWDILSSQYELSDRNKALRLLSCLTVLGLSHRNSGHRTEYLPKLVTSCKGLFEQVAVCSPGKIIAKNPPIDPTLKKQIHLFKKNVLILKPITADTENVEPEDVEPENVEPFALNFSEAWENNDHRYTEWLIHDRLENADEMVNALFWLMTQTSGILCQISLEPRHYRNKPEKERNVQIIGPDQWISFLGTGHGHLRKSTTFAPYKLKDDTTIPLLCVDEPVHLGDLKKKKQKDSQ
jgi:hypothetical protein